MLRQCIIEDVLAIGILFEQRKIVECAEEQQRQRYDSNLCMQNPTPEWLRCDTANGVTACQQH